jgi:SprT-like family
MSNNPTRKTYEGLDAAYAYFNEELFGGRLPPCLITVRHHRSAYGYFSGERFASRDGSEITDEIALNPKHFRKRTLKQILSTLVHEMVHLEQHHFGKASRNGYHNKQWAAWMERVGLMPSNTGEPGGKCTGQQMTHYVLPDGTFARAIKERTFEELYYDREEPPENRARKLKVKYTCLQCHLHAWAKPEARIACCDCSQVMVADFVSYATKGDTMTAGDTISLRSRTL